MRTHVFVVALSLSMVSSSIGAEGPMPVSPGGQTSVARISERCPTFQWTAVEAAEAVELVFYRVPPEETESPPEQVLSVTLPGAANGWTPSLDRCLERGSRYAWSVRAVGERANSDWSPPSLFEVSSRPTEPELMEALATVRRYFEEEAASNARDLPPVATQTVGQGGTSDEAVDRPLSPITAPVASSAVLPVGELDCGAARYENNGDGTVTDCRTGLVWLQNGKCDDLGPNGNGLATWQEANDAAAALLSGTCGLTDGSAAGDWRLPTKTEWMGTIASALRQGFGDPTLTDARGTSVWTTDGDAFINVTSGTRWTATEWVGPSDAWHVNLFDGAFDHSGKLADLLVWPVRAGP